MTHEMINFLRTHIKRAGPVAPLHTCRRLHRHISLMTIPSYSHEQTLSTKTTLRGGKNSVTLPKICGFKCDFVQERLMCQY